MHDVAFIVLAAGQSRRMGAVNKLLLEVRGAPLLCHVVRMARAVSRHPVTVVTGADRMDVVAALGAEPVNFVHNDRFAEGQMTSVGVGLGLAPAAAMTVLALGDQPFVSPEAIAELVDAHAAQAGDRITVPFVNGQRGIPIVIPCALREQMLADPMNLACRGMTRQHPELVHRHDTDHSGFVADIDTPEDYARLTGGYLSRALA